MLQVTENLFVTINIDPHHFKANSAYISPNHIIEIIFSGGFNKSIDDSGTETRRMTAVICMVLMDIGYMVETLQINPGR